MLLVSVVAFDGRSETDLLGLASGDVSGHTVVVGSAERFAALGISTDPIGDWPERLRQQGQSVLLVAVDGRTAGFLGFMEGEMRQNPLMATEAFPTDTTGLPKANSSESFDLAPGAQFDLRIAPVTKRVGDADLRMLAYNGSIPGPMLRVQQGSELLVNVVNDGDLEATVHWHGLRLDNRYDGTSATQRPIKVGGRFTYKLTFQDPGVYWYHPHIRQDYGQEMGLYGNIVVVPAEPDYWPPVNREITLALDDVLIENGNIAPFNRFHPTYTAMGRFGNVILANGETDLSFRARQGEVVRFYFTNTANTRVFDLAMRGARMKLVGGDSGRVEHEVFVDSVVLAPSERLVVDVLFDQPGQLSLEHRTPAQIYKVATITVADDWAAPQLSRQFLSLRDNSEFDAVRARIASYRDAEPDKTLALVAEMDMGESHREAASYVCPMHPEVTSVKPDRCPQCGMKLLPAQFVREAAHGGHHHTEPAAASRHEPSIAGIEWEDDMVDVNRLTNPANMRWKLIDRQTNGEGAAIDWRFRVGDLVKIRLVNEMDSDHPMHHPFHMHGAGRFLILARDGVVESNLVWKDTVLVPTGQTVDILFDVTHPGVWMAHCHIAEHHESGMVFRFHVDQ